MPAGGIALWVKARKGLDVDAWARSARDNGAVIVTAAAYTLDGRAQPFLRLGFASLNAKELREGVRRLVAALPGGDRYDFWRVKVCTMFVSHVLPSSRENACSVRNDAGVMSE